METKERKPSLVTLFFSILYISAFTFGGGFVIVTFMKKKFVDQLHWIDEEEMLDYIALAQSSPGAIAVNASILVGWKIGGLAGMLIAVLAAIIPPMAIITAISFAYQAFASNRIVAMALRGMQAGVGAVMLDVVFTLGGNVLKQKSWILIVLMIASFLAAYLYDVNASILILTVLALVLAGNLAKRIQKGRKS
ncbi:MAG: chromate transporter [Sphaerochaeta sp.]|jgi:chromate transporter|nr:chromate transporter [Sphaerochaeta sp.]MCH3919971.1 chromate transporter [Sphaerochaeta sp.]MCI2045967.1 chromate transporter [Sphaerochaeta sp.]MCI2076718.1 chromate transporter [Sphaerochaeta sp.]MCI2097844.1 chromate transporter [Sphaerochaeta sp.]